MDAETRQHIDNRFTELEKLITQRFDLVERNLGDRSCVDTRGHYPVCTVQEKLTRLLDLAARC